MSMWDEAEKKAEQASQGGMFLSLKGDGDSVVVAFCGEEAPYGPTWVEEFWTGSTSETYDPDKHDGKPSAKVKLNVYNVGENKMQILKASPTMFKSVLVLRNKYGLDKQTFEITRSGAAGDKKTSYTFLPDGPITPELAERIKVEPMHDLSVDGAARADSAPSGSGNRGVLMDTLKALPRPKLDHFLKTMEVAKVKDIPANKLIAAMELAQNLKDDPDTVPTSAEVDPFAQ